jgi:steroid delta-isomerase-like uncharacterized protein
VDIEANKALVRRYIELWGTSNPELAQEILAKDFVDHSHPLQEPGPEAVTQEITSFREAFPDVQVTIEHMLAEKDSVAFYFTVRGTHLGTFSGCPPTDKEVVLTGADFMRIADGKIAELWSCQDTLSWVLQLGMKIQQTAVSNEEG